MSQKFLPFLALLAVLTSCNKSESLVPVTVHLSGFTIDQEDFPSTKTTEAPADYEAINALTLAFYKGSTEVEKITQLRAGASSFGTFSLSLPCDSYTLVAVAHTTKEESPFVLTSPTEAAYTGAHAYDTFVCTQPVSISTTSAVNIEATLDRIVSQLKVVSSDGKTADVTNVRMTLSAGGRSFNPTTGLATSDTGFSNTVGNSATVGSHSTSSTVFFLSSDEQTMDVTIETLDAQGHTLSTTTVNNVTFKRNRVTKLTGPMYTNSSVGSSFLLNTDWLTETTVNF